MLYQVTICPVLRTACETLGTGFVFLKYECFFHDICLRLLRILVNTPLISFQFQITFLMEANAEEYLHILNTA